MAAFRPKVQDAAVSKNHFWRVTDDVGCQCTTISVREVRDAERVDEVARMLSGDASKKRARELAEELLG